VQGGTPYYLSTTSFALERREEEGEEARLPSDYYKRNIISLLGAVLSLPSSYIFTLLGFS